MKPNLLWLLLASKGLIYFFFFLVYFCISTLCMHNITFFGVCVSFFLFFFFFFTWTFLIPLVPGGAGWGVWGVGVVVGTIHDYLFNVSADFTISCAKRNISMRVTITLQHQSTNVSDSSKIWEKPLQGPMNRRKENKNPNKQTKKHKQQKNNYDKLIVSCQKVSSISHFGNHFPYSCRQTYVSMIHLFSCNSNRIILVFKHVKLAFSFITKSRVKNYTRV